MKISREITNRIAHITTTAAAYGLIGAETVKSNMTRENMAKALALTRSKAVAAGRVTIQAAGNARDAVRKRKAEIQRARCNDPSLFS